MVGGRSLGPVRRGRRCGAARAAAIARLHAAARPGRAGPDGAPGARAGTLRAAIPPDRARPWRRAASAGAGHRPGGVAREPAGASGAARHPQDACLRALPRGERGWRHTPRRLVRAGALHRRGQCRVLRAPLRHHDVVDPDAVPQRALGRHGPRLRRRGAAGRRAGRRPAGGILARLLLQHFQPGAAEARRDDLGDAEEGTGATCPRRRRYRS